MPAIRRVAGRQSSTVGNGVPDMKSPVAPILAFAAVLLPVQLGAQRAAVAAPGPVRAATATLQLDANGISEPMKFDVPSNTRSVAIVVEGDESKLYALASLRTSN